MKTLALGVRRHPESGDWNDVSDFVVHFTKDHMPAYAGFQFDSILRGKKLEARSKFGIGKNVIHCKKSVCFSETPLHELKRIAKRRSPYGLGFHKDFMVKSGGGPVFYAYGEQGDAMRELIELAKDSPESPVWRVVPFVEQPDSKVGFEWEREWRMPHDFSFEPSQVRFLIAPEKEHPDIQTYFAKEEAETSFPPYRCRLIDSEWEADRLHAAWR
jgi:hypothetical protein